MSSNLPIYIFNKLPLLFLIRPLFRGFGSNPYKNVVGFLVDLKTPKSPFDINWPLKQLFEMANINFNSLDPTQKKEIQKWADSKRNQSRIKHFGASIRQQTEHKKPPSSSMAQSKTRRPKQTPGKYS
jgi:hypothetical protein